MMGLIAIITLLQDVFIFLGYFSTSGSFPEPLTNEEEEKYFELYKKEGDMNAKDELIYHNLRLVAHIIKKYSGSTILKEDLISIGTVGLIKAVNSFDYGKGAKFATYASRCIHNEILMSLRSENKLKNNIFLEDAVGSDEEGNNISLMDIIENDQDEIHDKVDKDICISKLSQVMDKVLTEREKNIITLRYGLNGDERLTQITIAEQLGISRSYVSRIEKKAISKLSYEFRKNSEFLLS